MTDFAVPSMKNNGGLPASPGNYIAPKKHPQSAMSPTIVTDQNGNVRIVIGAAGGVKIPTGVSMVRKFGIRSEIWSICLYQNCLLEI